MSNIKTITLGKIGKVSMCKRVMKYQTNKTEGIPFFKISTFGEKAEVFISNELYDSYRKKYSYPKKGDILISAAGTVGKTVIYDGEDAYFQDSNIIWINNDESIILNPYLYYFYQTKPWITTGGSTIKRLYNNNLRDLKINFPELKDQKKIASVLSSLDSKIKLNNKINTELESMAKILYDYWFVQFDFPNEQGKPYKSSGGKMVWNEKLKREIPEGWLVDNLGNILQIQKGVSYKSSEIKNENGIAMINLNSFNLNGTYKENGIKHFSGKIPNSKIIKGGDLLIASTDVTRAADIIGKSILVPKYYEEDITYSMDISKIIPKDDSLKSYLMMLFNSKHYHNYIKWFASGTLVLHLNDDGIKWYPFEKPAPELIKKWNEFYHPIFERICETQKQNYELVQLRDFLLPMLMNGQVKVK